MMMVASSDGGSGEEMTRSLAWGVQVHCTVSVKQSMRSVSVLATLWIEYRFSLTRISGPI